MNKSILLNVRDLLLGACIGITLFSAGYVLGAAYPPSTRPVPLEWDASAPAQVFNAPRGL